MPRKFSGTKENGSAPSALQHGLERRLLAYAIAAGAGALAVASPTHAQIVFTPSNATVGRPLEIDLNNDGTVDFTLQIESFPLVEGRRELRIHPPDCSGGAGMYATGAMPSNGMVLQGRFDFLAALKNGTRIGSSAKFINRGLIEGVTLESNCVTYETGYFANTYGRFLGVRFSINGQVHYGWIGFRSAYAGFGGLHAQLYGWAYETQPNTPIIAGDWPGAGFLPTAEIRSSEPTNLELLAAGHMAVADWHRRTGNEHAVSKSADIA